MKKRISALLLLLAMALCLAGCGDFTAASTTAEEPVRPEAPLAKGGETVDVGNFSVTIPQGWLGVGEYDVNEKGEYFLVPCSYVIVKGGESAGDQYMKPMLSIYYSGNKSAQEMLEFNLSPTNENTEFEVTVGDKTCPAFHSVLSSAVEGEEPFSFEYDNVFIPVTDSSSLRVTMLTFESAGGATGISAADADVLAIMESLKAN